MWAPLRLRNKIGETFITCLRSVVLVDHFYSPHHCQWATKKVLDSFVRSIKRGNCPAFKRYNLLITGFTFVGFIGIKGIDCTLSGYWLLVEVIVPTVFDLYVFFTASFRSEPIVVFYKFALGSEKDHNSHPLQVKSLWFRRCICKLWPVDILASFVHLKHWLEIDISKVCTHLY